MTGRYGCQWQPLSPVFLALLLPEHEHLLGVGPKSDSFPLVRSLFVVWIRVKILAQLTSATVVLTPVALRSTHTFTQFSLVTTHNYRQRRNAGYSGWSTAC